MAVPSGTAIVCAHQENERYDAQSQRSPREQVSRLGFILRQTLISPRTCWRSDFRHLRPFNPRRSSATTSACAYLTWLKIQCAIKRVSQQRLPAANAFLQRLPQGAFPLFTAVASCPFVRHTVTGIARNSHPCSRGAYRSGIVCDAFACFLRLYLEYKDGVKACQ